MAKSRETYSKKENEKKKQKKMRDKAEKKEMRKANKGPVNFEDMIAYVDENGNITSTPPDPSRRKKINAADIELGATRRDEVETIRKGRVSFFEESKGYGFIEERDSRERLFFHVSRLIDPVAVGDKVTFEVEMGEKGPNAVEVKLLNL
jgi:cold shock CspA family protein